MLLNDVSNISMHFIAHFAKTLFYHYKLSVKHACCFTLYCKNAKVLLINFMVTFLTLYGENV